ncbi:MAG: TCR/Tet family MFS transporter [Paracoccaceae bacterium]
MSLRTHSALFAFGVVAIDAMGIGIIIPVMPDLMEELTGASIGDAARWGGFLAFSYALMQFVFSPIIGALSDRYGRRPVLMISLATLGVDYLLMAMTPALWVLFIGRLIAGAAGATYATASAYIADVTPREKRAAAFGLVGAGFGVGFVFGPVIGGLMGEMGTRAPFYAAAVLSFVNLAYGLIFIPESLAPANRRAFSLSRANPLGAMRQVAKLPMIGWFVGVIFLYALSHAVYPAVWSYFAKEGFDWSPSQIGWSLALVGIGFAVVQMGVIRLFLKWFGEVTTTWLGLGFNVIGLTALALVTQGWMLYALMPLIALGDVVKPALMGLMSQRIADDAQGELQGVIASAQSITAVVGPLMMTQVFALFTTPPGTYLPGAPFLLSALAIVMAAVIFRYGLAADKAETR